MATKKVQICLFLVLALMLCRETSSQSSCSNNMINSLSSCITYLRGNSSRPLPACCSSLANIVQSQPDCLCPMLSRGATSSLGFALNRTLAMALPATCQLQTPQCDEVADEPASSPALSPRNPPSDALSPPAATPAATADFPSGSKTDDTSDSESTAATTSIYLRTITLMIAAWIVSTFHFQN